MNTIQNSLTATAIAAALSLSLSGVAVAEVSPAAQKADALMLATNDRMDEAGDAVSDTWITTKVKSTLLAEDATPGMDIEVETKDGVVSLSGTVAGAHAVSQGDQDNSLVKPGPVKWLRWHVGARGPLTHGGGNPRAPPHQQKKRRTHTHNVGSELVPARRRLSSRPGKSARPPVPARDPGSRTQGRGQRRNVQVLHAAVDPQSC